MTSTATKPAATTPEQRQWREDLRDYQIEAVEAALHGLREDGRGTIVMACGSGKTIVGVRTANVLAAEPSDSVLVLAPSLALLDQLYRHWHDDTTVAFAPLAVCSDDELGADLAAGEDAAVDQESLGIRATTDPQTVADFLAAETDLPKVVFATYHSSPVVAAATTSSGHEWTLSVCDEAHRTAGRAGSVFTTVLSNAKIPSRTRLFLTASPRVHATATSSDGRQLASMDNENIYGPRLYTYTFGRGIAEGWLSDYRVLVLAVDSAEVYRSIHRGTGVDVDGRAVDTARAAAILGLLRAAREHDLSRVIAFHNTISASRHFAADLSYLAAHLGDDDDRHIAPYHLDGLASPSARRTALAAIENPPPDTSVVVNNVRVLGEGVDIPALDGVMFAEPKSSQIDVIQAVGRAIRPNAHRESPSVVIVPVYLARGENPDAVLSGSTFKHVWQVLNALRDHDAALDAELAAIRRNAYDPTRPAYAPEVLPERILVEGLSTTAEAFADAIVTMLLDHTTTTWSYGYDRFVDYYREHNTGAVPSRHVDPTTQFPLGSWVQSQRQAYRWGRLTPEQTNQLEDAGFEWGQRSAQWRKNIALVRALVNGTGSNLTVTELCLLAPSLATWFRSVQERDDKDRLTAADKEELGELCRGWAADPLGGGFIRRADVDDLLRLVRKRGGLPKKGLYTINGRRVSPAEYKELLEFAARYGLLDDAHRDGFTQAGLTLPPAAVDVDITDPNWEAGALRHVAVLTANIEATISGSDEQHRSRTNQTAQTVTLEELLAGPRGFWQRIHMTDPPQHRHGFDDILPRASDLVEDAESRAGRDDDFVVCADNSVRRRPQGADAWSLSGRLTDHVDSIVCIADFNPPATPQPSDQAAPATQLTVAIDAEVAADDLPPSLNTAIQDAVARAFLPDKGTLLTQLLKSYGIKHVHVFDNQDEGEACIARAHRRGQQPAVITEQIGDDINAAMHDISVKILRESIALTVPKVATAYRAGRLEGWLPPAS